MAKKIMIFWSKCKQDVKILSNFAIRQGIIPLQRPQTRTYMAAMPIDYNVPGVVSERFGRLQ
jgi:hypothetical protein